MNEQIKELFKRAGGKTTTQILASNPVQYREYSELWDDKIQRFAELIIKETLEVARAGIEFGPSMDEAVYTYFGIENE